MSDSSDRHVRFERAAFPAFRAIATRWMDNDHYGHVNNVIYYSWFDTAVNGYLLEETGVDTRSLSAIGLVVENGCRYFSPLSFPDAIEVGLAVDRLSTRSVTYRLGVFRSGEGVTAAVGHFVHVYVDRITRTPTPIPDVIRSALSRLVVGS